MDSPNPRYLEERNRVLVGNLPEDFLRFNHGNEHSVLNGHSQPAPATQQQYHQQQVAAQPMVNQITLTIVQAQLTKNYSLTKMDPYVRVRIGHSVYETHTSMRAGKFPNWNKTITSYLPAGIKTVHFEIFDECTLTPDERIAYADLVIPDEVLQGKHFDDSIPLSGKQGTDKEGFLNVTLFVRSVPYWSSMMQAPVYMPHQNVMVVPGVGYPSYHRPVQAMVQYQPQPMINPNYAYAPAQLQPYRPTEEEIKQLQEMFPAFDKEVILGVLETTHGNKDQAITSLLSLSDK